jgi:hypothetical protein
VICARDTAARRREVHEPVIVAAIFIDRECGRIRCHRTSVESSRPLVEIRPTRRTPGERGHPLVDGLADAP